MDIAHNEDSYEKVNITGWILHILNDFFLEVRNMTLEEEKRVIEHKRILHQTVDELNKIENTIAQV
jgi:hypothetical protein